MKLESSIVLDNASCELALPPHGPVPLLATGDLAVDGSPGWSGISWDPRELSTELLSNGNRGQE